MQLFYGEFSYEEGSYEESKQIFENILNTALIDTAHEKLFIARLYESLARSYSYDDEKDKYESMKYNFLKEYPQLIPFSGFSVSFKSYYFPSEYFRRKSHYKRIKRLQYKLDR